jgi:membrane-associated phospholipid phosphatase
MVPFDFDRGEERAVRRIHWPAKIAFCVWRSSIAIAFFFLWYLVYAYLNSRGIEYCRYWKPPNIYFPCAVYFYVFVAILVSLFPFYVLDNKTFCRVLFCYISVSIIFFYIYYAFPVCMDRVAYDGNLTADSLMRVVVGLDDQANCFPSSHCMFATMAFLGTLKSGCRAVTLSLVGVGAVAVCVSTVLVGQHYVWDVVLAVPLTAIVFESVFRLVPSSMSGVR